MFGNQNFWLTVNMGNITASVILKLFIVMKDSTPPTPLGPILELFQTKTICMTPEYRAKFKSHNISTTHWL